MRDQDDIDELLGVTKCAKCGHRLVEGAIECPFCPLFEDASGGRNVLPKWIYLTACFLTSPFSIYFVAKSSRLGICEKAFASLGCFVWLGLWARL
jgi:hypothetical protein